MVGGQGDLLAWASAAFLLKHQAKLLIRKRCKSTLELADKLALRVPASLRDRALMGVRMEL